MRMLAPATGGDDEWRNRAAPWVGPWRAVARVLSRLEAVHVVVKPYAPMPLWLSAADAAAFSRVAGDIVHLYLAERYNFERSVYTKVPEMNTRVEEMAALLGRARVELVKSGAFGLVLHLRKSGRFGPELDRVLMLKIGREFVFVTVEPEMFVNPPQNIVKAKNVFVPRGTSRATVEAWYGSSGAKYAPPKSAAFERMMDAYHALEAAKRRRERGAFAGMNKRGTRPLYEIEVANRSEIKSMREEIAATAAGLASFAELGFVENAERPTMFGRQGPRLRVTDEVEVTPIPSWRDELDSEDSEDEEDYTPPPAFGI